MTTFTENDRYDYPAFNADSLVIDAGGYEGNFAQQFREKYGCRVLVLEPVREFWMKIQERFAADPMVTVLNVGLAGTSRKDTFGIKGDMSGVAQTGAEQMTEVALLSPTALFNMPWLIDREIDLLKLNIEGCEFEVLEALVDDGMEMRFRNIQVQPHGVVTNAAERWAALRNRLLMNFRVTHEDPQLDRGWLLLERK